MEVVDNFEIETSSTTTNNQLSFTGTIKNVGEKRYAFITLQLCSSSGEIIAGNFLEIGLIEHDETKTFTTMPFKEFVTPLFDHMAYVIELRPLGQVPNQFQW